MYVWRGKGRRDRRHFKLFGDLFWGAPKGSENTEIADEQLRIESEQTHMGYFFGQIRPIMHKYLNTEEGNDEINLVIAEFKRIAIEENKNKKKQGGLFSIFSSSSPTSPTENKDDANDTKTGTESKKEEKHFVMPEEAKKRKSVYEVFRRYDEDGSDSLDSHELRNVLNDLNVPVSDKEFDELLDELDENGDQTIDFDEFYNWFVGAADKQRNKNIFSYAKMYIRKVLFEGLLFLVLYVEARNLLLDEQVFRATDNALKEFRIAHPPMYGCDHPYCTRCFLSEHNLKRHKADEGEYHARLIVERQEEEAKYKKLLPLFKGAVGRKLKAKRVLYSEMLTDMQERLGAVRPLPYRPRLLDDGKGNNHSGISSDNPHAKTATGGDGDHASANSSVVPPVGDKVGVNVSGNTHTYGQTSTDKPGRREEQLRNGMLVQGFDAKAGIRPIPRQFRLKDQHRASGIRKDQIPFNHLMVELLYINDDQVDIIVAPEAGAQATVKFMWKGYASTNIQIIGEFNGWKPEVLGEVDAQSGRCYVVKKLAAGKYRYRYIIDDKEIVDDSCYTITDLVSKDDVEKLGGVHGYGMKYNKIAEYFDFDKCGGVGHRKKKNKDNDKKKEKEKKEKHDKKLAEAPGSADTILNGKLWDDSTTVSDMGDKVTIVSNMIQIINPKEKLPLIQQGLERALARKDKDNIINKLPEQQIPGYEAIKDDELGVEDRGAVRRMTSTDLSLPGLDLDDFGDIDVTSSITNVIGGGAGGQQHIENRNSAMICQILDLRNLALYDDGAWALASFLYKDTMVIKEIDLSNNNISDDGMQGFCSCIRHLKALRALRLNSNGFGYDGIRFLFNSIHNNNLSNIVTIELSGNRIANDGCEPIGHVLKQNTHIKKLYLANNYIADDGIHEIALSLHYNRCLEVLDLSKNRIGLNGARVIADVLKLNSILKELYIQENRGIGSDGVGFLGDMVEFNTSLELLDISDVDLLTNNSTVGVHGLTNGLKKNKTLRKLYLRNNGIKEVHIMEFVTAFAINRGLIECDFGGNKIKDLWYQPDTYLATKATSKLPTIRTSLDRNIEIHKDPELHAKYSYHEKETKAQRRERLKQRMSLTVSASKLEAIPEDSSATQPMAGAKDDTTASPSKRPTTLAGITNSPNAAAKPTSPKASERKTVSIAVPSSSPDRTIVSTNIQSNNNNNNNNVNSLDQPPTSVNNETTTSTVMVNDQLVEEGFWTQRRQWKPFNKKSLHKRMEELEDIQEYHRIKHENEYVEDKLYQYQLSQQDFIGTEMGKKFIGLVCKVLTDLIYELNKCTASSVLVDDIFEPKPPLESEVESAESVKGGVSGKSTKGKSSKKGSVKNEKSEEEVPAENDRSKSTGYHIRRRRPRSPVKITSTDPSNNNNGTTSPSRRNAGPAWQNQTNNSSSSSKQGQPQFDAKGNPIPEVKPVEPPPKPVITERVYAEGVQALIASYFSTLGCDRYMRLHPEKLQQLFHSLALPLLTPDEAQAAVDATLIKAAERISFKKCCEFIHSYGYVLSKRNKWARLRILADVFFHPPEKEAIDLYMHYHLTEKRHQLTREYRHMEGKAPKYICLICNERFSGEKALLKHTTKPGEHVRSVIDEQVMNSESFVIKKAKFIECGAYFPSYYELNSEKYIPNFYYPQVIDKIGDEGRPIGVIEPNVLLRAEDTLGDFIKIRYENTTGWVRYKGYISTVTQKKPKFTTVLVPGFHTVPDFWKNMNIYSKPKYYRYNDELPENTQLKVRLKPDVNAVVVEAITENMIVECWGVLDDMWLQIRYNKHECAWVLYRNNNKDVVLMLLHEMVQKNLYNNAVLSKQSPMTLPRDAPELFVDKKLLRKMKNQLNNNADDDDDAVEEDEEAKLAESEKQNGI